MDNNNRPEYNDRERHNSIKKKLKIRRFHLSDCRRGFHSYRTHRLFLPLWAEAICRPNFAAAFVGLPLLGIGFAITSFAFRREISRYVKNESVPVINEAGKELTPAVRDIASRPSRRD